MGRFDKGSVMTRAVGVLLASLLQALLPGPIGAQLPPDEPWRTLETDHFRVTYPDGLLDLAQRAGERGETAWELLSAAFVPGPRGKVDLVISDHVDFSNGYARVFPSNRIVIYAPPPVDGFGLAHMDEWMELVITHELVHVFHEDLAGGPGAILRKVLGRYPAEWPFFPGSATPGWTVEGIATWYESALTQAGRVRGSFHEMVVRTAVLEGAFESIDQASGDSHVWPGGQRYYIYGSLFLDHLLERYGEARMGAFVEAVAGQWIPYRLNAAAEDAFGISFSQAWGEWEEELRAGYRLLADSLAGLAPPTVGETLTPQGYYAQNPAPAPVGDTVAFARQDGRSDTQIRLLEPETRVSDKLTRTNRLANLAWTPRGRLLFSQTEYVDSYRVRGDLYLADTEGSVVRLTEGLRLDHPHVHPSGGKAVAVQEEGGTNRLVLVRLSGGEPDPVTDVDPVTEPDPPTEVIPVTEVDPITEYDPLAHWAYPRWSPDGRWIAVARWTAGAHFDVVILDGAGNLVREVTRDRAIDTAPAWTPDGRWLLWASDRSGIPNLHAVEVAPGTAELGPRRQVTNVLGGAGYPAVDSRGEWIYFSGYHADGWHIERIRFDPGSWFDPFPLDPDFLGQVDPERFERRVRAPEESYNPLPTLAPRYWSPEYRVGDEAGRVEVLGPGWGVSTSGEDLVGRHGYDLGGTFSGSPGGFEGWATYRFARLGNPVLSLFGTQVRDADGPYEAPDESGDLLYIVERERTLGAGATLLRRRSRNNASLTLSGHHVWQDRTLLEADLRESVRFQLFRPESRLADARASVGFSTARHFASSISSEDGVELFVRGRIRKDLTVADSLLDLEGHDGSLRDLLGEISVFKGIRLPGFGNHVLALRGSAGMARGPGADEFHFEVGGASGGQGPLGFVDLGTRLLFPVRGYGTAWRSGNNAWSATAEYRFPIHLVNRGLGLFPLHLDWISGSLFLDAGNAWGPELGLRGYDNPRRGSLASVGGEIMVRTLPLWYATFDLRLGLARPLVEGEGVTVYLRLGPSF